MQSKQRLISFWKDRLDLNQAELSAFESVKREDFISESLRHQAYDDVPLPILRGKTISQPSTVMLMTSALDVEKGDKIFEIGTGSGYQTAILSKLVGDTGTVVSCEIIPELVNEARKNLLKAECHNVKIYEEDGTKSKEEFAPYDKIIITAASRKFPPKLIEQLKIGGVIVGPVGDAVEQEMVRGIKGKDKKLELEFLGQFMFSPLYGKFGFEVE